MKKYFKNNTYGWDMGNRFKIISRKKWGDTWIYKLRFDYKKSHWIEYQSHEQLLKERCFDFNYDGSFKQGLG